MLAIADARRRRHGARGRARRPARRDERRRRADRGRHRRRDGSRGDPRRHARRRSPREKAGIFKPRPARRDRRVAASRRRCRCSSTRARAAGVATIDDRSTTRRSRASRRSRSPARTSARNAAAALAAIDALERDRRVGDAPARRPRERRAIPGGSRWPATVILDGAHNPHGARALAATLRERGDRPVLVHRGVSADKDVAAIARSARARGRARRSRRATSRSGRSEPERSPRRRDFGGDRSHARRISRPRSRRARTIGSPILIAGSLFLVGEARVALSRRAGRSGPRDPSRAALASSGSAQRRSSSVRGSPAHDFVANVARICLAPASSSSPSKNPMRLHAPPPPRRASPCSSGPRSAPRRRGASARSSASKSKNVCRSTRNRLSVSTGSLGASSIGCAARSWAAETRPQSCTGKSWLPATKREDRVAHPLEGRHRVPAGLVDRRSR